MIFVVGRTFPDSQSGNNTDCYNEPHVWIYDYDDS